MNKLKESKLLRFALTALLLVFLCCYLPQELLFLKLCLEQDREIPPHTEVLISACKKPGVWGVPGGEFLFVREGRAGKMYLLDLRTGAIKKVPNYPELLERGVFLSPELVWLKGSAAAGPGAPRYRPNYILDLTTGKRYELLNLGLLPRLEDRKFDPKNFSYIESADMIFIHHYYGALIALPSDFRESPGNAVILYEYPFSPDLSLPNGMLLEQVTNDLGLDYEVVDFSVSSAEVPSPTKKYIVRSDGVYLVGTNQLIRGVGGMNNYFRSWYYDESAVIVQGGGDYLFTFPGVSSVYYIPSPVLKLNLPNP
ncbi:MAG: hypothetical protein QY328_00795 [Anaerolineales bacterium]|jgi:hypothetical protein|nr:MAG: hypothetical protein QY328_00795 [Anaerolineales bacterium]